GVERGEVQRHVGAEVVDHPARQVFQLRVRVVQAGDEQRRQLEPDGRVPPEVDQRLQHRLQVRGADVVVELLGEPLEVHVGGVDVAVELRARLGTDLAGGDRHGPDAPLPAGPGHVDGVLVEDDRVVVGEGHAAAAELFRRAGDQL